MIVHAVKTQRIEAGELSLTALLDTALSSVPDGAVIAISSKVVSLCENRVVPEDGTDKETLIPQEAEYYLDPVGKYKYHFTITNRTLIGSAGIDISNSGGNFVLWPADSQQTANDVRRYLKERFGLTRVGVIITDSTSKPLRLGTTGIALAHSGFEALHSYVGTKDLFGRPFVASRANIAEGLATTAVMVMGEGSQQTPICIMEDAAFITFQDRDPSAEELQTLYYPLEDDLFAPLFGNAPWKPGRGQNKNT